MRERCNSMGVIEFLEPEFDLNNVVNGLCVNFDGSRRVMRYAIAHEMMVDYARITGTFPSMLDAAGTLDTVVQICINASKLHPTGRLPILQT